MRPAWPTLTASFTPIDRDGCEPFGLYLGTTGGELWMSDDEGGNFRQIAAHLPEIYSVVAAPVS